MRFAANVWLDKIGESIEWEEVYYVADSDGFNELEDIMQHGEVGECLEQRLLETGVADGLYRIFVEGDITFTTDYYGEVDFDVDFRILTQECLGKVEVSDEETINITNVSNLNIRL